MKIDTRIWKCDDCFLRVKGKGKGNKTKISNEQAEEEGKRER